MKKVLLLGSELGKGGAQRSIQLLSYFLQDAYDVTLCVMSGKDRGSFYKTCDRVVFVDPPDYTNVFGKIKAWRHRVRTIKKLKKDTDVCISFLEGPDYINVLTKGKEKVVISIRGSKWFDREIAGKTGVIRKKFLIPFFYKKADQIVCVTQALAEEMKQYFGIAPDKLKTIYNFYEIDDLLQNSRLPLTDDEARIYEKPVIIASGRLHMAKEYDKLIQVFGKVREQADCRLMILGDGNLKQKLTDEANNLGLSVCDWEIDNRYRDADVYFMGYQVNAFKYYAHSKMFALSSSYEGFPNVMAEALICNIPVVSTDCHTGPREIFNVEGLPDKPIETYMRLPTGSLLPLIDKVTDERLALWVQEITYWLSAERPEPAAFKKLTDRFTKEHMLKAWKEVIEN